MKIKTKHKYARIFMQYVRNKRESLTSCFDIRATFELGRMFVLHVHNVRFERLSVLELAPVLICYLDIQLF